MHYNAIQGNAAKWGVMPWHYYLTNSLPKLMMVSAPIIVMGGMWVVLGWVGRPKATAKPEAKGRMVVPGVMVGAAGEIWGTLGWGVLGLVGGLSCVGHKVSQGMEAACLCVQIERRQAVAPAPAWQRQLIGLHYRGISGRAPIFDDL